MLQSVAGQEPGMWHLTDEDGLPSMTVYNIAQDSKGYIWMGTEKGICRFDGKVFNYYKSPEFNDSEILRVVVDQLDRIWFLNLSGQLFYIENELVYNAKNLLKGEWISVVDLAVYGSTVWLSLKKEGGFGIARFSSDQSNTFPEVLYYDGLFGEISPIILANQSTYAMVTMPLPARGYKLIQMDNTSAVTIEKDVFDKDELKGMGIPYFHNGELFLLVKGPQSLIFTYKEKKLISFLEFEKENTINGLTIIDDYFWITTRQGIFKQAVNIGTTAKAPFLLDDISVNHLMADHEGNKWISTTGNGVYVITAPQISVFQTSNYNLPSNEIYSLEYDDFKKRLLIGHDKGLISTIDKNLINQEYKLDASGRTLEIISTDEGDFWCANDRGLFKLNTDLLSFKRLGSSIKAVLKAKGGSLFYCAYNSVGEINKNKINVFNQESARGTVKRILGEKSYALYQTFSDDIWMGTIKGIYIYKNELATPFLENGIHKAYNVASITQTSDSVIWVGTRGEGVLGIKEKEVIYQYSEADGLASNTVKKITATNDHLWIGTDNGLNKLDLKTKKWKWINKADGLPSNEVNDIEIVEDQVWVGTAKGLVNFSINTSHTNIAPPPIYISGIKLEESDTTLLDSFYLPYNQNSIQVDFTGIGFRGKGDVSYQYKMSGADEDWITTKFRFARYPNLQAGDYRFEVLALNEDKTISEKPATIYFSISPPWWQTWWFRTLSVLIIAGIISYFINARIQKQKRERAFLNQVNELKTQALRSQMNPHFIFNALNAIQKFLTINNREQAMIYLSRFGKLIRLIFEQSQKEKISLEEELEFLNLYLNLEKLRFMDKVDIQMKISPELLDVSDEISIPPLLIQPIIENSFKHGFLYKEEPGILKINFSKKDTFLICTIEDDGIGRKKAAELGQQELKDRPSSGLKTAQERLNIYSPVDQDRSIPQSEINVIDLNLENGEVSGTMVEVKIYCSDFEFIE